jgi:hypothetical protein
MKKQKRDFKENEPQTR